MIRNIENEEIAEAIGSLGDELLSQRSGGLNHSKIKLLIAEEQEIFREAYRSFFSHHPDIETIGSSQYTGARLLTNEAKTLSPDVILLGVGTVDNQTVAFLEALAENSKETATVVVAASYDNISMMALRRLSRGVSAGHAYLLKHKVNSVHELTQVILGVAEGRMVIDPPVLDELIIIQDPPDSVLKDLSQRELEVLGWMAEGYRNSIIADLLTLELKTVERHINSIFSKLGDCPEAKDMRVYAITLFLTATGRMPASGFDVGGQLGPSGRTTRRRTQR